MTSEEKSLLYDFEYFNNFYYFGKLKKIMNRFKNISRGVTTAYKLEKKTYIKE